MPSMREATLALIELLGKAPEEFGVQSPTSASMTAGSSNGSSSGSSNYGTGSTSGMSSNGGSPIVASGQWDNNLQPWEVDPCVSALSMVCPREGCAKQFNDYDELMRHIRTSEGNKDGKCRA